MLILKRRINQAIKIGKEIRITIIDNHNGNVALGIEAPKEMLVIRTELIEKKLLLTAK